MYYNGKEISLTPSIGNYEFPCQSHYFIRHNRVEWCLPIRSKKKKKPVEYEDEEDEPPIQIVRTAKKPKKKDQ